MSSTTLITDVKENNINISLHRFKDNQGHKFTVYVIKDSKLVFEAYYFELKNALEDYHNMQEVYFGVVLKKYIYNNKRKK